MNNLQIYEHLIKDANKEELFKYLKNAYHIGLIIFLFIILTAIFMGFDNHVDNLIKTIWAFLLFVDILSNIFLSKILVDNMNLEEQDR